MPKTHLKMAMVGALALLTLGAVAAEQQTQVQSGPIDADVQKILDKFRAFRPEDKDLAIFQLDWTPTLKEAKEKAAKDQRPILLIVVTNSYGNMYTGHC